MPDPTCPTCGHAAIRHPDLADAACNDCRREADPFRSGNPRRPEDICTLTSRAVRGRAEASSFFADREASDQVQEHHDAINQDRRDDRARVHHLLDEDRPTPYEYEERR